MARPKPTPNKKQAAASRAAQRSAGRAAGRERSAQLYYGAKPTVSESGFAGLARAVIAFGSVAGRAAAKSSRAAEAARAAGKVQRPGGVGSVNRSGKSYSYMTERGKQEAAAKAYRERQIAAARPPKSTKKKDPAGVHRTATGRRYEQVVRKKYGQTTSYPRYLD